VTEFELRDEVCRVGRSLHERGYVHATAGNISVRLDDGFLITPTDACLGTLDPIRLARLDGSVEALFCGSVAAVNDMIAACWKGPRAARVEAVEQVAADPFTGAGFTTLATE